MSKSKHIDLVCVIALLVAIVIAIVILIANPSGTQSKTEDASSYFSSKDLLADWDTENATVINLEGADGSVAGNGAYLYEGDLYIVYAGKYVISGELTDGSIIVDADKDDDIWILMDSVSVNCDESAALHIENADHVYLTLADGSHNRMTSGDTYTQEAVEEGINAVIFSRDDLTINGSGTLSVSGNYRHGIVAKDDLVLTGGGLEVMAAEDAIHANDSVRICNAQLSLDAGDDGITVSNDDGSDYFYMESGSVTIHSCYEGLEATTVKIAGGDLKISPSDDGINATGVGEGVIISGGTISVVNPGGMDADGIDSNGSITISGGSVFIAVSDSGGSTALDYGSESGGKLIIDGGTVLAFGSSRMLEEVHEDSRQGFVVYAADSVPADAGIQLYSEEGELLLETQVPCGFSAAVLSSAEVRAGDSYSLVIDGTESVLTGSENAAGFGMGIPMGGPPGFGLESGDMPMLPEDMELPEGVDPSEGMEPPEGVDPSEGMEPPGGVDPSEGMESAHASGDATVTLDRTTWMMLGFSAAVIALGMLISWKYKGKM